MGPKGRPDTKTYWPTDRRWEIQLHSTLNSVAFSPQENYTDCVTTTVRQILVLNFADRGVSRCQRGGCPTAVYLCFLGHSRCLVTYIWCPVLLLPKIYSHALRCSRGETPNTDILCLLNTKEYVEFNIYFWKVRGLE
jgi:hypothetical protein